MNNVNNAIAEVKVIIRLWKNAGVFGTPCVISHCIAAPVNIIGMAMSPPPSIAFLTALSSPCSFCGFIFLMSVCTCSSSVL